MLASSTPRGDVPFYICQKKFERRLCGSNGFFVSSICARDSSWLSDPQQSKTPSHRWKTFVIVKQTFMMSVRPGSQSSGGYRIFPRLGVPTPKNLLFSNFLPKTEWNWKNLDPWRRASLAPPYICQCKVSPYSVKPTRRVRRHVTHTLGADPQGPWSADPAIMLRYACLYYLPTKKVRFSQLFVIVGGGLP